MSDAAQYAVRDGIAVLEVTDTGVGVSEAEQQLLFDRFHRVTGAWSRSHEGTGIGLALVRELSRLQGGDVRVDSRPGEGTTFTVTLPWTAVEPVAEPAVAPAGGTFATVEAAVRERASGTPGSRCPS